MRSHKQQNMVQMKAMVYESDGIWNDEKLSIGNDIAHAYSETYIEWLNYSEVGGGTLQFFPSFPFPPQSSPLLFPSLPPILRSRPAPFQWFWESAVISPSVVWGGAPAEIVFGGNNFNDFPPNGDGTSITRWRNDKRWNGNFRWWNARHRWRNAVLAGFNHCWYTTTYLYEKELNSTKVA